MDWIHCNVCYDQPAKNKEFVLTSCGHIFCTKCENRGVVDRCKICNMSCVVTKLTANMKPEVRAYFEDIDEMAKKLNDTIRFQKSHRYSLFRAHKKIAEKYQAAKIHIRKLENQNAALKRKLETYEKSRNAISPRSDFHFTPTTNKRVSPFFNSVSSSHTSDSTHKNTKNASFRMPDLRSYQNYRIMTQRTPTTDSPAARTPKTFSTGPNLKSDSSARRLQSKFPLRTPPYSDFNRMSIDMSFSKS